MLALDDPRWGNLEHAYGAATDIPALLSMLAEAPGPRNTSSGPEDEPWFGLWSALCHQGEIYTASYAALPHIVEIARVSPWPLDFSCFQLPAAIEIARCTGRGPDVPLELAKAYHGAVAQLVDVISLHRHEPWDEDVVLSVAAAQAIAKGHVAAAEALLDLDSEWIGRINRGAFG